MPKKPPVGRGLYKKKNAIDGRSKLISPRCTICNHPERVRIEQDMANNLGKRGTAKRFGASPDAIQRHWQNCTSDALKVARKTEVLKPGADAKRLVLDEGVGLLENLRAVRGQLMELFDEACADGSIMDVTRLSAEIHNNLKMLGKSTGELSTSISKVEHTHVVLSPSYINLRRFVIAALRKHPGAMDDVLEAFRRCDQEGAEAMALPPVIDLQAEESSHAG